MCPKSRFWITLIKLSIKIMKMTSKFGDAMSSSIFFDVFVFLLLLVQVSCQYRCWFCSYDNLWGISDFRKPEIGNTSVWILSSIWRLSRVKDSKFSMNVSNRKLLNAAKCQVYSFHRFWAVIKEKLLRGIKDYLGEFSQKRKNVLRESFNLCIYTK